MEKLNTLVIFGGASNEYEVSLRSVITILENIDREKFNPILVGITKDGRWYLCDENLDSIKNDTWMKNGRRAFLTPDRQHKGLIVLDNNAKYVPVDLAFLAVHGQNCEDGSLQGLLKLARIPFIGAGVASSAVCFDKEFTHIIAERAFVPMAKWIKVDSSMSYQDILTDVKFNIGFPAFIKPANSGSSVGTAPIMNENDLKAALENAFLHDRKAIIEEHIKGHEVECAVMGNRDDINAYETGEIVSLTGFYDYDSKYKNDSAKLLMPADISPKLQERVKELAVKAYRALDCRGYARVDFFVTEHDEVIFNEINTLPGFTSISMWPQMMCRSGYDMKSLITKLLELAMEV